MYKIKSFPSNKKGRDFVVGDIHGHFTLLRSLLERSGFDTKLDRVFSVGDLIDRGPESIEVLDWLKEPWFHAVRGNHEQMLIDCVSGHGDIARHTRNGGAWLYELAPPVQHELSRALQVLPLIIEVGLVGGRTIAIVHAQAPLTQSHDDWQKAKDALTGEFGEERQQAALKTALYSREKIEQEDHSAVSGISRLYVGHSTVSSIVRLGNVIYTDTGCSFFDGALSIIEINSESITSISMHP